MRDAPARLEKVLAERGLASRRRCAAWIAQGRVTVNEEVVTEPGTRVDPARDTIALDGNPVPRERTDPRTIVMNKPRGVLCSTSSRDGRTIYSLIPDVRERLVPVGRLDKNSEGLVLMSNDGDLANRLTHPRFGQEKTYRVAVSGEPTDAHLKKLRSRLVIDGYRIQPAEVECLGAGEKAGRFLLEFTLREGRNRQIRKMCELAGLRIHRLVRVRIGNLRLTGLRPGQWRDLNASEIKRLLRRRAG